MLSFLISACGGNITKEGPIGILGTSGQVSSYHSTFRWIDCAWKITAPPGKIVVLE